MSAKTLGVLAVGVALLDAIPAQAQTATERPFDILPQGAAQDDTTAPRRPRDDALRGTIGDDEVPTADTSEDGQSPTAVGDSEAAPQQPTALGGMGDEPQPLPPGEEIEEEEEAVEPLPGISFLRDDDFAARPPLHTALQPEAHDLDPYLPIGMRVGSFILFGEVETGTIMSNNVLGTNIDPHGDIAYELASRMRLQSDWARHSFVAEVSGDRSWYRSFPVEDDRIYQALLRGRIDVTDRTFFGGELEMSQTQAGRNSVNLTDIIGVQTNLHEKHAIVSAGQRFNRLSFKLSETFAQYNYDDFANTDENGIPLQDVRDYDLTQTTLRSTYEFNPAWAGFIEGSVNSRDYREPVEVNDIRRSSDGFVLLAGANVRLAGTLFGEINFGWGEQQSIDDRLAPVQGPLLNADLIWMPSPATKVEFLARSDINETTLEESLGAIDRFYELSIQHAFWRYLVLGAFVSYEVADFVGVDQVDQRVKYGSENAYYFNPVVSVYANWEHTDFFSTSEESDFTEDEFRVGVKLRR